MKVDIYYFSGTGNTLFLARELARRLAAEGDEVSLRHVADVDPVLPARAAAERVVIAFPVYFFDLPDSVRAFLERLEVSPGTAVYTLDSCGEYDWGVLASARRVLKRKDVPLAGHFMFRMSDNSIVLPTDPSRFGTLQDEACARLDSIAATDRAGSSHFDAGESAIAAVATPLMRRYCVSVLGFRDIRLDAARCSGCGTCARVCPTGVLSMIDGRPAWGARKDCAMCFACVHHCPAKAVRFRGQRGGEDFQYRNSGVSLRELFRR